MCRGEGAASAKGLRQVLPSQACAGDQGVSVRLETGGAGCLLADVGAKAGERHLTWSTWSYTGCVGCSRSSLLCAGSLAVESRGSSLQWLPLSWRTAIGARALAPATCQLRGFGSLALGAQTSVDVARGL